MCTWFSETVLSPLFCGRSEKHSINFINFIQITPDEIVLENHQILDKYLPCRDNCCLDGIATSLVTPSTLTYNENSIKPIAKTTG